MNSRIWLVLAGLLAAMRSPSRAVAATTKRR